MALRWRTPTAAILLALIACTGDGLAPPPTPDLTGVYPDDQLVEQLRAGGYVVVFRHTATDRSIREVDRVDLSTCEGQRNLSATGRTQARAVGEAFAAAGVPVVAVLSGPHCRAIDTAEAAFGRAEVTEGLLHLPAARARERARIIEAKERLLAQPPEPGTNTVLVTHNQNIEQATGLLVSEGEAVIVRPDGDGGFGVVGRVPVDGWSDLLGAP